MQMIGRRRMSALVRFLRALFANDEDSESLITARRTLIAGYAEQTIIHYIINVACDTGTSSSHPQNQSQ